MKPQILVTIDLPAWAFAILEDGYALTHVADPAARAEWLSGGGGDGIRAVLTNGSVGLDGTEIAALPDLEIICVSGAGYDQVDLAAADARGIPATHGPATNDVSVIDHALALMLDIMRGVAAGDRAVRRGDWAAALRPGNWEGVRAPRPIVTGKRLGIVGLGNIGMKIARRAEAGFEMTVAYYNRSQRDGVTYTYCADPVALAEASDVLMLTCPGGPATRHLVDAKVLRALGPEGFLVNVSRGSVVDTDALTAALRDGTVAGAALDVVEGEPAVPDDLLAAPNLVVTPHLAGRSPESVRAFMALVRDNLDVYFSGQPLLTPIPAKATREIVP